MKEDKLLQKLLYTARIKIDDSEKEVFSRKVNDLIKWGHEIDKVDTNNINPTFNVLEWLGHSIDNAREDKVNAQDCSSELIKGAPDKEDMFIAVPKIIE